MKRTLSFILALVLLIGLMPMQALATEGAEVAATGFEGKTVSILGDSISTYTGVSNSTAYNSTIGSNKVYYSAGTLSVYQPDTWWQQVIDVLGMELCVNNAWSGSAIFGTRAGTAGAYVDRCVQLHNDQTGEEPDVILVFMGTNDFSYTYEGGELGSYDLGLSHEIDYTALIHENEDGSFTYAEPTTSTEAYAIMLHKMQQRYPNAEIYCMSLMTRRYPVYSKEDVGQPTEFNAKLKEVIDTMDVNYVELEGLFTSDPDDFDLYMGDKRVHPNKAGMDLMTEAVVSAMLGEDSEICTVTNTLTGVINNNSSASALIGGSYTAELSTESSYSNMTVIVTMNGEDVTEDCYADSKITISDVTGDIVITAAAQRAPLNFRWDFTDGELVSTGDSQNALTQKAGTITDGVFSNVYYSLTEKIVLRHDLPWCVEFTAAGSWSGMLFSATQSSSTTGNTFFFKTTSNTGFMGFGERTSSQYNNYGIALGTLGVDTTLEHTYRLENRIASDGTNMVYLLVDGVDYGAMNNYFIGGSSDQNITVDWPNSRDFTFAYIGANNHALNNCSIDYIQVWEAGQHTHSYTSTVTAPTCTEQGYTTYTCDCGKSYVDDYVDSTGHSYESGICTGCGAEHPNLANYEGKVISILGGSTCTFDGYIPVADGFNLTHRPRYPQSNLLTDVNDTWWMQVIAELGAKLGVNDSWAGSQVLNTLDSNSGDLGPDAAMASLTRVQNLGANGTPDIILFYGAMNDIGRAVTLGSFDAATAPAQVDLAATKWDNLADAYVAAIMRMQHYYPDAQIVAMLPGPTASYYTEAERQAYCEVLKAICDHYGVPTVDLSTCGLTTSDMPDGTHPNAEGMDYITNAVLETLLSECQMEAGKNVVHSVTHELTGAESSLGYYKGVSDGKPFVTTITGEDAIVTVTMGGVDISDQVYADGKVVISAVTGDVVITAKGAYNADGRLQQLPNNYCCNTNLWTVLDPVNEYYTASGWGNNSNSNYSVTFPVTAGDRIWATSFGAAGTNGYSANAVRITWFSEDGVLESLGRDVVYAEFAEYGYITVPGGAVSVNIPMASDADTWEIYILNRDHTYENGVCLGCGAEHPNLDNYKGKVISILGDSISTFAGYIPTADGFNLEHIARYPQDNLLTDVNETWWMQLLTELDAKLGINESWRSTEVGNIYDVEVNSGYEGTKACMASLTRIQNLGSNGTPDVILFYGGTNDITQRRTVGTFDPATAPTEVDLTSVKWDTVADAYVAAIMRMQYYYPDAEIIAMLPTFTSRNTDSVIEKYNSVFAAICEHYGVTYIDLRYCGIATSDLPDGTHPDAEGMDYITEAVLEVLMNECDMSAGEHIVHTVTHELAGAEASHSYYKGISDGSTFKETVTGEDLVVTVTMGGKDVTASVYSDGVIHISAVTGDVVITAIAKEKPIYADYLQEIPDDLCFNVNLWDVLEHDNIYYTSSGWGNLSGNTVYSVTIPVSSGDQLWATSFQAKPLNGNTTNSTNGIRVTWFSETGVLKSMSPAETYAEFTANGYLTAPEGAVAFNIPMWNGNEDNEIYLLNRDHCYENGVCVGCGEAQPGPVITKQPESVNAAIGEKFSVTVEAEGEGLTYQWYYKNNGGKSFAVSSFKSKSYAMTMATYCHNRQIYCVITDANGNSVQTDTVTITAPLTITRQPADVQVEIGQKASISVSAVGDGLSYQWYYKDRGSKEFKVSSYKGKTYSMTMAEWCHMRQVYCVITDSHGNTVTTEIATMSRPPLALTIVTQPQDVQVEIGEKARITVEADGEGLTYQWYYKDKGSKEFKVSSYKGNTYSMKMAEWCHGRQVYCVITDQYGNQVTTDTATMTRSPMELKILTQPTDVSAAVGEKFSVRFTVQGEDLTYQWYYKNKGDKAFKVSSFTGDRYSMTMANFCDGRQIYCVITDQYGNQVTTEVVTLTVEK